MVSFKLQRKDGQTSRLDFVELCGSEQAVAEDRMYQGQSTKEYVTSSFNTLSSLLVRAILGKVQKSPSNSLAEALSATINS